MNIITVVTRMTLFPWTMRKYLRKSAETIRDRFIMTEAPSHHAANVWCKQFVNICLIKMHWWLKIYLHLLWCYLRQESVLLEHLGVWEMLPLLRPDCLQAWHCHLHSPASGRVWHNWDSSLQDSTRYSLQDQLKY